jgi:carboxymethylenebutenolidase
MTPQEMVDLWAEHIKYEFVTLDVEATLATMVDDASVNHVPIGSGGKGKDQLRVFYRDVFIGSWPEDLDMQTTNRVIGLDQLVEEDHLRFTHTKQMDWFLPGLKPTNRLIEAEFVVVVQFRDGKLSCERIYWDHARVLRQVRLL